MLSSRPKGRNPDVMGKNFTWHQNADGSYYAEYDLLFKKERQDWQMPFGSDFDPPTALDHSLPDEGWAIWSEDISTNPNKRDYDWVWMEPWATWKNSPEYKELNPPNNFHQRMNEKFKQQPKSTINDLFDFGN
jgi:hypothetical protein